MPDQIKSDQKKYTNKLNGKKVLILGGSSGIGYGVAEASLENGATVIISSSNPKRVDEALSCLKSAYPSATERVSGHACNLGDEPTLEQNIVDLLEKTGKGIDHLIFTAGDALAAMKLPDSSMDKIKQAGMVRFFAPLTLAKHAPKYMNAGPEASIILTTGAVSERPIADWAIVGSFATGLQGMNRQLALDLKPLRCNLVSPGVVDTDLWGHMSKDEKAGLFKHYEGVMPTGRVGQVEDVAEAYLYLMKDKNITGAMISTSGGHLLV